MCKRLCSHPNLHCYLLPHWMSSCNGTTYEQSWNHKPPSCSTSPSCLPLLSPHTVYPVPSHLAELGHVPDGLFHELGCESGKCKTTLSTPPPAPPLFFHWASPDLHHSLLHNQICTWVKMIWEFPVAESHTLWLVDELGHGDRDLQMTHNSSSASPFLGLFFFNFKPASEEEVLCSKDFNRLTSLQYPKIQECFQHLDSSPSYFLPLSSALLPSLSQSRSPHSLPFFSLCVELVLCQAKDSLPAKLRPIKKDFSCDSQ